LPGNNIFTQVSSIHLIDRGLEENITVFK